MDPEILHERITSGDPGRITAAADDAYDAARRVDRARDSIAHGVGAPVWWGGAAYAYQQAGQGVYVAAAGTSWGLYRVGDFLLATEDAYVTVRRNADEAIELWRTRGPGAPAGATPDQAAAAQHAEELLRRIVLARLEFVERDWSSWLSEAAGSLDDDGGLAFQRWLEQGAARDYRYMMRTGARRGFRIPASLLNGNADGWIQQGLAHKPGKDGENGYYLVSSYRDEDNRYGDGTNDPDESRVDLVDDTTGEPIGSAELTGADGAPPPTHSGGIAVRGDRAYVVGGGYLYTYDLDAIRGAEPGRPVPALSQTPVETGSYITIKGGTALIGDTGGAKVRAYDLEHPERAPRTYDAPPDANGVVVRPDGGFTFTVNNGRDAGSSLDSYPPYQPGDSLPDGSSVPTGNLVEEAVVVDGRVVSISEAGADAYSPWDRDDDGGDDSGSEGKEDDLWGQTHSFVLPADALGGDGFEVEPATLEEARRAFLTATDRLEDAAAAIARTAVPARIFGEVDGAGTFSTTVESYYDECASHLREGTGATTGTADGLWDVREAYEGSDDAAAGGLAPGLEILEWAGERPSGPPPSP